MKCIELKNFLDKESGLDISEKKRTSDYVTFRRWYYYFCYKYAVDCFSLNYVGKIVGTDHANVIHNYNKLVDTYPYSVKIRNKTDWIEDRIVVHFGLCKKENFDSENKNGIPDFRGMEYKRALKEKYESKIVSLEKRVSSQAVSITKKDIKIRELRKSLKNSNEQKYRLSRKLKLKK